MQYSYLPAGQRHSNIIWSFLLWGFSLGILCFTVWEYTLGIPATSLTWMSLFLPCGSLFWTGERNWWFLWWVSLLWQDSGHELHSNDVIVYGMIQSRALHHSTQRQLLSVRERRISIGWEWDISLWVTMASFCLCTNALKVLVRLSSSSDYLINQFSPERNSVLQVGLEMWLFHGTYY